MAEFTYQDPFPLAKDDTEYRLLTSEHVSVKPFDGQEILKVEPEALTLLARRRCGTSPSCCARSTSSRWPRSSTTPRPATTTAASPWRC